MPYDLNGLWDRITSVSDKAAIKVLIAIAIGYLLFKDSGQVDEKDNTIRGLRMDVRQYKTELLECNNERNDILREESIRKDSIISKLTRRK